MNKKNTPFKFNKNSMVNYVRNMREDLNESAFTLIELIVVMAILAILVLLAAPQFLGYTSRANDAQIQNDAAVVESMVTEELVLDKLEFDSFGTPTLSQSKLDESKVYNKSGELVKTDINPSDYKEVPSRLVDKTRTQLDEKGTFYSDKDGNIIFLTDGGSAGSEDGQPDDGNEGVEGVTTKPSTEDDLIGVGYALLDESDFDVIDWGGFYDFKYTGSDTHIIIPEYIDGIKVESSWGMFEGNNTVQSVASTNSFTLSMGGMFSGFEGSTLDLREIAHHINHSGEQDIIGYVGNMFQYTNLDSLNMSGVDFTSMSFDDITSDVSGIFAGANIETLIVGRYEDAQALNELLVRLDHPDWHETNIGQVVYGDGVVYEPTYDDDDSMDEGGESVVVLQDISLVGNAYISAYTTFELIIESEHPVDEVSLMITGNETWENKYVETYKGYVADNINVEEIEQGVYKVVLRDLIELWNEDEEGGYYSDLQHGDYTVRQVDVGIVKDGYIDYVSLGADLNFSIVSNPHM